MSELSEKTIDRIQALGFECETPVPADRVVSASAALSCLPMYMVSNVHGWTGERQFKFLHVEGTEAIREAFAIGRQKADLPLEPGHDTMLSTYLDKDHPSDRLVYEYALETLRGLLTEVDPGVAETLRVAVARSIVAVAKAAGKGVLGTGEKVSDEERACIAQISEALDLASSTSAAEALDGL